MNHPILLSGHQPEFWPWMGFFHKIYIADKFAIVDHINFQKKNYQDRIRIRTNHDGLFKWIHVPIQKTGDIRFTPINEIMIDNQINWKEEQLLLLKNSYQKAPYFNEVFKFINEIYDATYLKLADLNITIIKKLCEKMDIQKQIFLTSEHNIHGQKTELLVNMCKIFNCAGYISGETAKVYFDPLLFKNNKLIHKFRITPRFEYDSFWKPFLPGMSILDCLFSTGFCKTEDIIKKTDYVLEKSQ